MSNSTKRIIIDLVILAVVLVAALICFGTLDPGNSKGGDANNPHVKACIAAGGTVAHSKAYGGKWYVYHWWCKDSDGYIRDEW